MYKEFQKNLRYLSQTWRKREIFSLNCNLLYLSICLLNFKADENEDIGRYDMILNERKLYFECLVIIYFYYMT